MPNRALLEIWLWVLPLALLSGGCAAVRQSSPGDAVVIEQIRQIERERLRALVDADLTVARRLHAEDFQLITPAGAALTKEEYLSAVSSGLPDYRAWEAGQITVRLYGDAAVIRYRDVAFEVYVGGRLVHSGPMYHTNLYERRGGQWQVIWSQASGVITP